VLIAQRPLQELPGAVLTRPTRGRASPAWEAGPRLIVRFEIFDLSLPDFVTIDRPLSQRPGELVLGPDGRFMPQPPLASPLEVFGLAELGLEAPSGAQVSFDDSGVLTVVSDGDLYFTGSVGDIPGLTHLELHGANIFVTGQLQLPPGVSITLVANDSVVIDPPPGDTEPPVPPLPPDGLEAGCLLALFQSPPREVGSFSMEAVRVRTVEVDLWRGSRRSRTRSGPDRRVRAVVFGSESLDVRDIKESSLRLGTEGAATKPQRRGRGARLRDWNQDGYRDLVVRFDSGRRGRPAADGDVCLRARLRDGSRIRGCDAIEIRARRGRGRPGEGA
jgi:hypothetical protein